MKTCKNCSASGCPLTVNRRRFLTTAGATAAAAEMGLLEFASSLLAAEPKPAKRPSIRAVFLRPKGDRFRVGVLKPWPGWPGDAYDVKGHQRRYTEILTGAAKRLGVDLEIIQAPLDSMGTINSFLENLKKTTPDGLLITMMCMEGPSWGNVKHILNNRGKIPAVVFSPMGTSFLGHIRKTLDCSGVFVGATQDDQWLAFGLRMLATVWQMKNTRLCVLSDRKWSWGPQRDDPSKTEEQRLGVVGTTLRFMPAKRFPEEIKKVQESDQIRAIADYYAREAKAIVEPKKQDILDAVRYYFACRRIMTAENCQGISINCIDLIAADLIEPPCLAFSRLRDEGIVAACEADTNAAISSRLVHLLFDRPGFMQDACPNTVNNTLMGAHCTCATKLDGFDKPHAPFILRTHSETDTGVATQVLWRVGQKITVMKFTGPGSIVLGTGRVLGNIDNPPAGGCRTSVEVELDDVPDIRQMEGIHQLFIYGDLERPIKAYCELAGIKVVHI